MAKQAKNKPKTTIAHALVDGEKKPLTFGGKPLKISSIK